MSETDTRYIMDVTTSAPEASALIRRTLEKLGPDKKIRILIVGKVMILYRDVTDEEAREAVLRAQSDVEFCKGTANA